MKIVIDTREQRPFSFKLSSNVTGIIRKKLPAGDYSIEGYENNIALERKSSADLFQTMGKEHKRFKKEIERAANYDYFAIIVEDTFSKVIDKEFENSHYCNMLGDTIIQICYTLKMKYGVDIIFCDGRQEATSICRHIFRAYIKLKKAPNRMIKNPDNLEFLSVINKVRRKLRCDQRG